MVKYNIGVLGCGAIFSRHIQAIQNNSEHYLLVGIYDIDMDKSLNIANQLKVKCYENEDDLYQDNTINCVLIITPNHLHYPQMIKAIDCKKHIIVEKPAVFSIDELEDILHRSQVAQIDIFTILQVRLNPAITACHKFIQNNYLGNIRGVSLVQRWQRPLDYFDNWRGHSGGGILREFAIHYLDALIYLIGMPNSVLDVCCYKTKFTSSAVQDTVYAHLNFITFGGNIEISIGAEPRNIECNLCIMSDNGYVKLGGKSLDELVEYDFLDKNLNNTLSDYYNQALLATKEIQSATLGASPYHPLLYQNIIKNKKLFTLGETYNVIKLIENIHSSSLEFIRC